MSKTYGQYCGLARALDRVGDRWTMLILRELLIDSSASFGDLTRSLSGVAPNLLVERLRQLEVDGLIRRNSAPQRSKSVRYELTELGRSIEPAMLALVRWGGAWMTSGPHGDHVDTRWGFLAMRALMTEAEVRSPMGQLNVSIGGHATTVTVSRAGRVVTTGSAQEPRAEVAGDLPNVLSVVSGLVPLARSGLRVRGDRKFAREILTATVPLRRTSSDAP